jgi:hypothetical protein
MPPKKRVKKSCTAPEQAAARHPAPNPFLMLPEAIHHHLLGFVVGPPPAGRLVKNPWELCEDHHSVTRVNKTWKALVGDVINHESAPRSILSTQDLAVLKSKVASIKFRKAIYKTFKKFLTQEWKLDRESERYDDIDPWYEGDDETPLSVIIQRFGGMKRFTKIVESEYKKFLVIKSVEQLAASLAGQGDALASWQEKCQPSKLVDLFWHAHMLDPQKYHDDCVLLVNAIIGHDAGYISPNAVEGSDYKSKCNLLFKYERLFPKKDYFGGRIGNNGEGGSSVLFDEGKKGWPHSLADEIFADMNGANDCG